MERLTELMRILYKAVVRPAVAVVVAVVVTGGTVLTISLLVTGHYVFAILVGLATAVLVTCLATSR